MISWFEALWASLYLVLFALVFHIVSFLEMPFAHISLTCIFYTFMGRIHTISMYLTGA